jgi:hypothetical protein
MKRKVSLLRILKVKLWKRYLQRKLYLKKKNLKNQKLLNQNHKTIQIISSCDKLLIKWFFKVLETGDLRYILVLDDYTQLPIYNQSKLQVYWDKITQEYDQLTGEGNFSEKLLYLKDDAREINVLNGLKAAYSLWDLDTEKAIEAFRYFGIKVKDSSLDSKLYARSRIMAMSANIKIQHLKREKHKSNGHFNYLKSLVDIENCLNRNLDDDKLTVSKWVYLIKSVNEKNEKLKQLRTHGRTA